MTYRIFSSFFLFHFSMFKVKCVKNVNAMAWAAVVRWKHVGCVCQISEWSVTIWKIVLMVHHVWWSAIVRTEPVKMQFNIYKATTYHRIAFRQARTASHRIQFDAIIVGESIIGKLSSYNQIFSVENFQIRIRAQKTNIQTNTIMFLFASIINFT